MSLIPDAADAPHPKHFARSLATPLLRAGTSVLAAIPGLLHPPDLAAIDANRALEPRKPAFERKPRSTRPSRAGGRAIAFPRRNRPVGPRVDDRNGDGGAARGPCRGPSWWTTAFADDARGRLRGERVIAGPRSDRPARSPAPALRLPEALPAQVGTVPVGAEPVPARGRRQGNGPLRPGARLHWASTGPSRCSKAVRGSAPTTRSTSLPSRITTSNGIDCAANSEASA